MFGNNLFVTDRFDFILDGGGSLSTIFYIKLVAMIAIILVATLIVIRNYSSYQNNTITNKESVVRNFFILYAGLYIFLSFLVTGLFTHPPEQYFYIVNLALILFLIPRVNGDFEVHDIRPKKWAVITCILIAAIALLAVIAINTHGEMRGSQVRFQ